MTMEMREEIIEFSKKVERSASYICRKSIERGLLDLMSLSEEEVQSLKDERSAKFSSPRVNFNIIITPELNNAILVAAARLDRKKAFIGRHSIRLGLPKLSRNEIGPL